MKTCIANYEQDGSVRRTLGTELVIDHSTIVVLSSASGFVGACHRRSPRA
jgi:hypothetical protein